MQTAREVLQQLIDLKIDLIPIKPGGKVPMHGNWNVPTERVLSHVINSFGRGKGTNWDMPVEEFTRTVANIGVLNATSSIITLDCDSPLAGKALHAACDALGGDINLLYPETSWNSVKGQKAMYRRPAKLAPGRCMFKVYQGDGRFDVIFELRGTGQDVLPPSWREDAQTRLAWFHEPPKTIPTMPKWLVALYNELNSGKGGPAFNAMCKALELNESQRHRTFSTTQSLNGYPDRMVAHPDERAYVNGHYDVAELLLTFGYKRDGKRFKPPGTHHSAGIVPPRKDTENWLCEHEGDVLAGVFDAWRVMVECAFDGNAADAAASVRAEQLQALSNKQQVEDPPSKSEQRVDDKKKQNKKQHQLPIDKPISNEHDHQHNPKGPTAVAVANEVVEVVTVSGDIDATPPPQPEEKKQRKKPENHRRGAIQDNFLTEQHEAIKPVLHGHLILTPGCHLLSAMPKAGKSTLLTAMALVAATGKSISGLHIERPVNVLYCALDENVRQNLQPRIQRLTRHKHLPHKELIDNLTLFTSADELLDWAREENIDCSTPLPIEKQASDELTDDELVMHKQLIRPKFNAYTRALYHYLRTNRIQFCAVDLITSIRVKGEKMQSIYERDLEEFMAFNAIAVAAGCAMVGAHHMNKAAAGVLAAGGNALAKVSGTNAISGAMQSIISMSHVSIAGLDFNGLYDIEPKGAKVIIEQSSRDSEGLAQTAFSLVKHQVDGFDAGSPALEWTLMGPAEDVLAKFDEKEFIRQYLYAKPENDYTTATEIYNAAHTAGVTSSRSADSFRKLPQRMVRAGHLESRQGATTGGVAPGFRLSPTTRAKVKARNDRQGY